MARPVRSAKRSTTRASGSRSAVLLLPPATGDCEAPVQFSSPAAPQPKSRKEHAGHAYHDLVLAASGLAVACDADDGVEEVVSKGRKEDAGRKLKRMISTVEDGDLYGLLELGKKRWRATEDDIKKAFRKISLELHPDKVSHLGEETKEDGETHYKKVLDAFNILSDKKRRMAYDSTDTGSVDDSLPSESSINDKNFYTKLATAFEINSRWSTANRVPSLGDDKTPIDDVNKFYDFWYAFKTWRDFSFDLEHDLDQAESREEKRWMDRQNQKHVKTRKLEEAARIRKLVDMAYKKDPRIRAAKDAVRAKKDAVKREKAAQREAVAEAQAAAAAAAVAEEERQAAVEKEQRAKAKKDKDAARNTMRRARQKLRRCISERGADQDEDVSIACERCCGELAAANIEAVVASIANVPEADSATILGLLQAALNGTATADDATAASADTSAPTANGTASAERDVPSSSSTITEKEAPSPAEAAPMKPVPSKPSEWQPEEMKRLTKALTKFPPGTRDRYEKLANFVGSRDAEACLAMVNSQRPKNITPSTAASGTGARRAAVVSGQSDFERFERQKKKCDVQPKEKPMAGTPAAAVGAGDEPNSSGTPATANGTSSASSASSQPVGSKPPNAFNFSPKQQAQLEAAMKKHSVSLGSARWTKIAGEVSERDAGDCESRFKELVSYYKAKKASVVK